MESQFRNPCLIQRLLATSQPSGIFHHNFWGNSSAKEKDRTAAVAAIAGFDNMGYAQFENGAVPQALALMASQRLAAGSGEVRVTKPGFISGVFSSDKERAAWRNLPEHVEVEVFILAPHNLLDSVRAWLDDGEASAPGTRLKDDSEFQLFVYLGSYPELGPDWALEQRKISGWLDIQQGFMYFTSRDQWLAVCNIFGVKPG